MTRRVSKHGTTYTEGSQATLGKYPKVCYGGCGEPLRISVGLGALWFEAVDGELRSWHFGCRPPTSARPEGRATKGESEAGMWS